MLSQYYKEAFINSSWTFYIRLTSIYYIGIMMLLVLKASPFLFSIEQYFVISLSQAGMHIYSRASAAGKRVQVSLYICWLSVRTIFIFYLVVSSMIHNICFCLGTVNDADLGPVISRQACFVLPHNLCYLYYATRGYTVLITLWMLVT